MNEYKRMLESAVNIEDMAFTVSQLNKYINGLFKTDAILPELWVRGEISNFRPHYSGHMYFTLKDNKSTLKCVMFKSAAEKLRFSVSNGMKALILGSVSVFERDGAYQLYCEDIIADGLGNLFTAFEQLKTKLSVEGLFDAEHKKRIPVLPKSVAIITSETGSVVKDIINVAQRRCPNARVIIVPVQVQGGVAAQQIADSVNWINEFSSDLDIDVIIVARGGGSLEDLWAFNEEVVARAVYASMIPVVSAVGHETDYTICDFVSDQRAPTPSAAAELVFPETKAIIAKLVRFSASLKNSLMKKLKPDRDRLNRILNRPVFSKPLRVIELRRMTLDLIEKNLASALKLICDKNSNRLSILSGKLYSLSPVAVMKRGYSVVTDATTGAVIKSVRETSPGGRLNVAFCDGKVACQVIDDD